MSIDEHALYAYIGRHIREQRRASRRTQQWLADCLMVERTSISNIETGMQRVPLHVLYRCCEIFDIEITDLIPPREVVARPQAGRGKVAMQVDGKAVQVPQNAVSLVQELFRNLGEGT